MMIERGPCDVLPGYFEVVGAMLFYIDEFPERLHHPKETELLFPKVAQRAPETAELIPLNGEFPRDPMYDRLFTRIVTQAPAPIGLGEV
jgi:hypothetical protein